MVWRQATYTILYMYFAIKMTTEEVTRFTYDPRKWKLGTLNKDDDDDEWKWLVCAKISALKDLSSKTPFTRNKE